MFEFSQFLGFLLFLAIFTLGFWVMLFLAGIVPYWIGGNITEMIKERRKAKKENN